MDQWSAVHRAFGVETIFKYNDSVIATQRILRRHYNNGRHRTVPAGSTIKNWVQTFRTTASAETERPVGTVRTVRTPENPERVRTAVGRSPKRSAHGHSVASNISNRSHRRILQSDLQFRPYKRHNVQELPDPNFASGNAFYVQFVTVMNEHPYIIRRLIRSHYGHFELSACVNKHNVRNLSEPNPNELHMKQQSKSNSMVWDISFRCHWSLFFRV